MTHRKTLFGILLCVAACSGEAGEASLKPACVNGLSQANRELQTAKASGLSGKVNWTKAAALLSAAKVQEQFEEYRNCVVKVRQARAYLRDLN